MSDTLKHVLMIGIICIIAAGMYYVFTSSTLLGDFQSSAQQKMLTDQLEREITEDLERIEAITIDTAVFAMPEYSALTDTTVQIDERAAVRLNPFESYTDS